MPTRLSVLGLRIPDRAIQSGRVLPVALLAVVLLTAMEWYSQLDFSLGIFYTVPVLVAATALNRWQIVLFGILCALARGAFTPATSTLEFFLKFLMASIAYCGSGLLVVEMSNHRRRLFASYARLKLEQDLRKQAEEQLRALAENSPAAILTMNAHCEVQAANRAAHRILAYHAGSLVGQRADRFFPVFANALQLASKDRPIRTSVTGWGKRSDEQSFPMQAWFSVHGHSEGRTLAAIVVDMSEEVRDREREHFQHLLDHNRLLAGAVSHEIRNMCSAIAVVCSNLGKRRELRTDADFDALTKLVEGLSRLASVDLRQRAANQLLQADLKAVLDQLRLVIEPDWEEICGTVHWQLPEVLPVVAGDEHGLLQIFLNLCQNSLRAVESRPEQTLSVTVSETRDSCSIQFHDSGPGVTHPQDLFQPFLKAADGSGLGLYISRELARSFGGELEYMPTEKGGAFRVTIPIARPMLKGAAPAAG